MKLNIGSIKLPITAATKGFALIGKRGSGKTYNGAVMAEEFSKKKVPFVVFDPIDVWWGLRLSADGKGKGLPVVVFGKVHADIQLDRTMGKKIAQAVVKDNISCVISTFGMSKTEMREIVTDFSEELLNINNTPRHVFIEEAHEYVPQRVFGAGARCFAAVEALIVMGRNRGIGVTLLNQRMATLNKDLVTQVDTLMAFRSVGPQDRKALKEWVEAHGAEGDFEAFMRSIPSLPTGEGWIWSPEWLGVFERVKIRKRETFHPDREKVGVTFKMPEIKQGDIQAFIDSFVKRPESNKVTAPSAVKVVQSREDLGKIRQEAYDAGVKATESAWRRETDRIKVENKKFRDSLYRELLKAHGIIKLALERLGITEESVVESFPKKVYLPSNSGGGAGATYTDREGRKTDVYAITVSNKGGAYRMLQVLASRYPMKLTRSQLATIADVKKSGGSFRTYLSSLRTQGLIQEEGDLIQATQSGIEMVGEDIQKVQSAEEVIQMWKGKLQGGSRRMFDVILDAYPESISRFDLSQAASVELSGGSFRTYLSMLKSNGLIETQGNLVKASDTLFID